MLCLIFFLIGFTFVKSSSKIVYVDTVKLFDGFIMTKELKRNGEREFNTRKAMLDSIYSKLQSSSVSQSEKEMLTGQLLQGKEEFDHFNQTFGSNETFRIWSRIRSYTEDFSKENNYKLIIGSENKTTVLYGDENSNITKQLLIYINRKYEGLE